MMESLVKMLYNLLTATMPVITPTLTPTSAYNVHPTATRTLARSRIVGFHPLQSNEKSVMPMEAKQENLVPQHHTEMFEGTDDIILYIVDQTRFTAEHYEAFSSTPVAHPDRPRHPPHLQG